MTDNREIQSNAVSNSSNGPVDSVEEGIWKMKIENVNGDCEKGGGDSSPPYPHRPGEPDCIFYLRTGLCGYGDKCRFNHPVDPAKSVQTKGELPRRDGQPDCGDAKPCPYYMRTYTCKFGTSCKFNHPLPASTESVLTVLETSAFGTSVFPSMGMPYASGISAWLLPRQPYPSGPRVPTPQNYASVTAPQGWNTYMGTVPPTSIYGTSFYNAKDQEGLNTGHFASLSEKNLCLPERSDQPECRYFMSTGSCKYGSDCKYHHPKEQVARFAYYGLGSHGLPLRPGEAVCSYFHMYGFCNYGSSCRFDHPMTGYVSSYTFNLQPLPLSILGPPFSSYQRSSSINYSESYPSKSPKISNWIQKPEPVKKGNGSRPQVPTTSKPFKGQ